MNPALPDTSAQAAACSADRRMLQVALAAYEAKYNATARSQDELVAANFLDAPVTGFAVDPAEPDTVRAVSPCAPD